jgi:pimeloyl-ACP methyl ester carboxylesterase
MGALWSAPAAPPPDPHAAALANDPHLLAELYPRTDGQKHTLRSGRVVGYLEYGDVSATSERTVLFFHGTPGTRFSFHPRHARVCKERGVRVIVVERPGFGLSGRCEGRTLLGFADDVVEVLQGLGVGEGVVAMGYSAGGPYALAFAKQCAERLRCCVVVSGPCPPREVGLEKVTQGMSRPSWWAWFVARRMPWALGVLCWLSGRAAVRGVFEAERADLSTVDNEVFRGDVGLRRAWAASTMELHARRGGTRAEVEDYRLFAGDWGFALSDLKAVQCFIYGGEEDDKCTPGMWRVLRGGLGTVAEASHLQPGKGHLYFYELFESILEDVGLVGAAGV